MLLLFVNTEKRALLTILSAIIAVFTSVDFIMAYKILIRPMSPNPNHFEVGRSSTYD